MQFEIYICVFAVKPTGTKIVVNLITDACTCELYTCVVTIDLPSGRKD